jgi:putative hemolysin
MSKGTTQPAHWPSAYPRFAAGLPDTRLDAGDYTVRFARDEQDLDSILRLRFEVFNLELGEGLDESYATGQDRDRFDPGCHHLLVVDRSADSVVGTYRMMTETMARDCGGFYSDDEFDLSGLPLEVTADAVEVGRACVARAHRNRQVLFLLWRGLAAYLIWNRKRYLFGCCSLTSQDPLEGWRVMAYLAANDQVHPRWRVRTRPGWECSGEAAVPTAPGEIELPRLFNLYLRYGARVCGGPALDRGFKTIDYLVLLDRHELDEHSRGMFFR